MLLHTGSNCPACRLNSNRGMATLEFVTGKPELLECNRCNHRFDKEDKMVE